MTVHGKYQDLIDETRRILPLLSEEDGVPDSFANELTDALHTALSADDNQVNTYTITWIWRSGDEYSISPVTLSRSEAGQIRDWLAYNCGTVGITSSAVFPVCLSQSVVDFKELCRMWETFEVAGDARGGDQTLGKLIETDTYLVCEPA
ncbi:MULTISPECIES: hypothetical protein [Alphaproteobacteria]|uniref:hypothetical protein n=1 Tax=Alphaproteobacteria TaxID=28211 RepID=UPI0032644DB9